MQTRRETAERDGMRAMCQVLAGTAMQRRREAAERAGAPLHPDPLLLLLRD
jgi:hypothetical protein